MRFVFICGSGRCGATLLRSLLDGHTSLNVYPIEVSSYLERFLENSGFCHSLPVNHISYSIFNQLSFQGQHDKGFLEVNSEKIEAVLESSGLNEISPSLLLSYVFQMVFGNATCWNVVDVTSPNIKGYLEFFENCKIIHLLRHPFDTLNSFYRERYKDPNSAGAHIGEWTFGKGFGVIRKSFQQAYLCRDNSRVYLLKLEDLQNDPGRTLKGVLNFLDLQPEPIIFEQTQLGRTFENNSTLRKSKSIFIQPRDWSSLTPNDLYFISKTKWAYYWYSISDMPEAKNSFWQFLRRQIGFSGVNRPRIRSIRQLLLKLLPSVLGLYFQDQRIKRDL